MVTTFTTHITPFHSDRTVYVYLPDDWESTRFRYPVLYMYDGHNLFFDSTATFGTSWGMKEYLDRCPSFIVVGIDCDHEGDQRLIEYCPYSIPHYGKKEGTGQIFMRWLVEELKPYVDATFPTKPERDCTAIGGSSMGGLMSLYSVSAHSDVFSKAACLSPSVEFCIPQLIDTFRNASFPGSAKIYISWGEEECEGKKGLARTTADILYLSHFLQEMGADVWPYLQLDGQHNEASWAKQVPQFMEFLYGRATP